MTDTNDKRDADFNEAALEGLTILKEGFEQSWAIVVGINDYGGEHPTLANAVNDAREIARILEEDYAFDYVIYLDEEHTPPTRENILSWLLDRLSNNIPPLDEDPTVQVGPNDRVIFFFAGHGFTRHSADGTIQQGFLIPQDATKGRISDYIDMSELHEACKWIPAKHILLILDCCFSGVAALGTRSEPGLSPPNLTTPYLRRITERKAWQIMTAGDKDDKAADSGTRPGHSAFTSALLDGLEGRADHNGDKLITASDLANYVRVEVTNQTAGGNREGQSPFFNYLSGGGQGDFVFVRKGDTPILHPPNVIEAEVKPLMQQYPWLWGVLVGLILIVLLSGGLTYQTIIIPSRKTATAQQEVINRLESAAISLQTAEARVQSTAKAGASEPEKQAAQAEVEETQKESTAVVSELNEALAMAGLPTSTPVPTATSTPLPPTDTVTPEPPTNTPTPSPTQTFTSQPPLTTTATSTPSIRLIEDFDDTSFVVHQFSQNSRKDVNVSEGMLTFDFVIDDSQAPYVGLEWRQERDDWSSFSEICVCMNADLSTGLGVSIQVGESDNFKAHHSLILPEPDPDSARQCLLQNDLTSYCADFDGNWTEKQRLGDLKTVGYYGIFIDAWSVNPHRGHGTLDLYGVYLR